MPPSPDLDTIRFEEVTAPTPDLEALAARAAETRAALAAAPTAEACLPALRAWDDERRAVVTHDALVSLRFEQDTTSPERKAAHEAWDEARPRWTELEIDVKRTLLAHPRREELVGLLGAQAFALWESEALAFDPALEEDLVRESKLGVEFTELLASAELCFRGEAHSLSTLTKYRQHADRDVRHDAERLLWDWFAEHAEVLDRQFDDLVKTRAKMARKLGREDFVELGYQRMCRVDYDRADVERFRAAIRSEVVPLAEELVRDQAARLGVDPLMAWDEYVHDPRGNPAPQGDLGWMLDRAQGAFDELGGGLDGFFRRMRTGGFLDLASRKGKAGGGFCTWFPTAGMPFVFANFNGTRADVEVLTHEIGHAFQGWSSASQWPLDYHWPTCDGAEVHSMSLELLAHPEMERFFGEEAGRFRRTHLADRLTFLPYGTAVDHFQHELYAQPDLSPAERHELWREMERTYLPWRRWGDLEYPAKGGRWQHQRHVYLSPFYYIDYVLAQTCAFQLWARALEDRAGAMEAYVALCGRGGSLPFQALVRSAGLSSPFDEGCLARVVARVREALRG